jgi:hypothetical protein
MQTTIRENWLIAAIVILALLLIFSWMGKDDARAPTNSTSTSVTTGTENEGTGTEEEMVPGENAGSVFVADQVAGSDVFIDRVNLDSTGWIFVREDNNGALGTVLGARCYSAGTNQGNMTVQLVTRPTVAGGTYHAELRDDNDGNCVYDGFSEGPIVDANGEPIIATFKALSATTTSI